MLEDSEALLEALIFIATIDAGRTADLGPEEVEIGNVEIPRHARRRLEALAGIVVGVFPEVLALAVADMGLTGPAGAQLA